MTNTKKPFIYTQAQQDVWRAAVVFVHATPSLIRV